MDEYPESGKSCAPRALWSYSSRTMTFDYTPVTRLLFPVANVNVSTNLCFQRQQSQYR